MGRSTLERIERFAFSASGAGGALYSITVLRPAGDPAPGSARIAFVLDADMAIGTAAEIVDTAAATGEVVPTVVVGIGYGGDLMTMARRRTADLTPPLDPANAAELGAVAELIGTDTGGAERFLAFILDELTPEIVRRCPAAGAGNLLFGHSLGGLFAAHVLLTRPDAFADYVVSSPSLWWSGFAALRALDGFADRVAASSAPPRVFLSAGAREQDVPAELPPGLAGMDLATVQAMVAASRMIDAAREFAGTLTVTGVASSFTLFADEDHSSVVPAALARGLRAALRPRP